MKVANWDVRYLVELADYRKATIVVALIVTVLLIIGLSAKGLAEGIESAGQ